MMPRLEAQETLDKATAAALGAGTMKQGEARRIADALRRRASGGPSTGSGRAPKASPQALAAMGIAVVPPSPKASEG